MRRWLPQSGLNHGCEHREGINVGLMSLHTAPEVTFGVTQNIHKNHKCSHVEKGCTIILMYKTKRSVGKFL